jgi:hypothetical protein
MDVLNRGELAEAAQVNIETLRYYERRGLILAPPRSLCELPPVPAEHDQPRTVCQACSGSWGLRSPSVRRNAVAADGHNKRNT